MTSKVSVIVTAAALGSLVYLIAWPMLTSPFAPVVDRPAGFVVEEPTYGELFRARLGKLMVFGFFSYFGACFGSFLNVVAASAPKGESIVTRSSSCPRCGTPIRTRDNWPLISYLALRGKCRACQAPIAERYFIVEIIAALIVGSLFLYELVTGAANIPGFQHYHHAGILWIVLYTKWPVMGIYLYHVMMFCAVLTFALMEWDGLRAPTRLSFSVILTFAALAIAIPTLQPVSFDAYLPVTAPPVVPEMIWRGVTCLLGGLAGWAIAGAFRRLHSGREFAWSLVLLGVSLGWQATLTIALLWMVIRFLLKLTWTSRPRWLAATPLLFALAMLHHPFWRFFSQFWWRLAG